MSGARDDQLCGDANAAYFWTPDRFGKHPFYNADITRSVKKTFGANIKLIVLLRDPVQRSISAYLHHIGMRSLDANVGLLDAPEKLGIIAQSCYGNNLRHWRNAYSDENIMLLPAPATDNHQFILDQALSFLGLKESANNDNIIKPVFSGLQRIQDDEGVWVNLTHPVFKAQQWQRQIAMRKINDVSHALLVEHSEIQTLIDILSVDAVLLQQQLTSVWQHDEFTCWLTWPSGEIQSTATD